MSLAPWSGRRALARSLLPPRSGFCLFPPKRALLLLGYADAPSAADDVVQIREFGPDALEGLTRHVLTNMERKGKPMPGTRLLPDGDAWLLVEFGGQDQNEANHKAETAHAALKRARTGARDIRLIEKPEEQTAVWEVRENGVGASRVPEEEDAWPSWEDAAVPPDRLGDYLRGFDKLHQTVRLQIHAVRAFWRRLRPHSHLLWAKDRRRCREVPRAIWRMPPIFASPMAGSLSGEHGDGQAKGELLPRMFGSELIQAFREFKTIWDPHWTDESRQGDRRLSARQQFASRPRLHDAQGHDTFPVSRRRTAASRTRRSAASGLANAARSTASTMCPSFQATREEMHSTRGRAHLLFEMLRGDPVKGGWRDPHVREALDLCLQCKGCKGDCPVNVDMATYKAEFLSHYYAGRLGRAPPTRWAWCYFGRGWRRWRPASPTRRCMLVGRYAGAGRIRAAARAAGVRAGDVPGMVAERPDAEGRD